MDIRDMKQRGQHLLGAYASVDGKLGEFADSAILSPDSIDLLAIQLVDKQTDDRIESHRDRRNRLVTVARRQGDAVRLNAEDAATDVVTAPGVAPLHQKTRGLAVTGDAVGKADLE